MAQNLTCQGCAATFYSAHSRLQLLQACVLLLIMVACARGEPPHPTNDQPVAKNDGNHPLTVPDAEDHTSGPPKKERVNPSPPDKGAEVKFPPDKDNEANFPPKIELPKKPELAISAKPIKTLGPLAHGISPLAFSPDDKTLAAGGWSAAAVKTPWLPIENAGPWSGEIKLWDVASGKDVAALRIWSRPRSLAFTPDAKSLLIASDHDTGGGPRYDPWYTTSVSVVWDYVGPKVVKTIKDDRLAYYIDYSYRAMTGKVIKTIQDDSMGWAPRLSPDGKHLAFMPRGIEPDTSFNIYLWDMGAGKRTEVLQGHKGSPLFPTFSPDGKMLASTSYDGTVKLWSDVGKNTLTLKVGPPRSFSPNGENQVDGHAFIADRRFPLVSAAFSHDNKTLAAGLIEKERVVKLFDAASGKTIASIDVLDGIPRNEPVINSLAFSPDGKTLAVGINAESKLWDVASGKAIATLSKDAVLNAVFSHDGKLLAVGTADGKVTLWEITKTNNQQGSNPK